jgi:hypothetical protein
MTSLIEQIKKAGQFSDGLAIKHGWDIDGNGEQMQSEWVYIRVKDALVEQHAQMIWAVEALELAINILEQEKNHLAYSSSFEMLAQIAALVPKGDA